MDSQSTNQKLRLLLDTLCRSITYETDDLLQKDVKSVLAEVKQVINPEVVDVVVEMASLMRRSTLLNRLCDRKNPITVIHNLTNQNWSQSTQAREEADVIYEEKLKPLLVDQQPGNGEAIYQVCSSMAWSEQNWYDWNVGQGGRLTGHAWGYMDDSLKGLYWADYWTNLLGFSAADKISKNTAVKLVAYHKARLWTAENVTDTRFKPGYGPAARGAALDIAMKRASEIVDESLLQKIVNMMELLRISVHLNRRPRLLSTTQDKGEAKEEEAKAKRDELKTDPLIGDKVQVDEIYEMCFHCAWHEQNTVDYDRCTIDKLTGEATGYKRRSTYEKHEMDLHAYDMGFDD